MKFGRTMIAEFKAWKTRDEGYGRALGGLCSHLFRQPWGGVQRRNERGLYKETGVPTVN